MKAIIAYGIIVPEEIDSNELKKEVLQKDFPLEIHDVFLNESTVVSVCVHSNKIELGEFETDVDYICPNLSLDFISQKEKLITLRAINELMRDKSLDPLGNLSDFIFYILKEDNI